MKNKKGFTLVELTISLAVLSIIAVGIMTLTASTMTNTYLRRINYLFKNECQNIITCFATSNFEINSNTHTLDYSSFVDNLEFYFYNDVYIPPLEPPVEGEPPQEVEEDPVGSSNYDTPATKTSVTNHFEFDLGYDSLFVIGSYDVPKYTIRLTINYDATFKLCEIESIIIFKDDPSNPLYELNDCYLKREVNVVS